MANKRPDLVKRESWRNRLEEFGRGDERIVDFCRRLGLSVWSFYYWQQRLRIPAVSERQQRNPLNRSTANAHNRPPRRSPASHPTRTRAQRKLNFVPIQVTGEHRVEVHLSNGTRVTVPCEAHDAIGAVVAAILSHQPEERPC